MKETDNTSEGMAASSKPNVDDVLKKALEIAEPHLMKCSDVERMDIEKQMKICASKEVKLITSFKDFGDASELSDAELQERLQEYLSEEDYERASAFIDQETFTMELTGVKATFHRENIEFLEPIELNSIEGVTSASVYQKASLVIEGIMMVTSVLGISTTLTDTQLRNIMNEIKPIIRQDAFTKMADKFVNAWTTGNTWGKAQALFHLVKESNAIGIFWKIIQILFLDMSWFDRAKNIALIAAYIAAAFGSDGISLMARIALLVNDAYRFKKKIENLVELMTLATDFK